MLAARSSYSWDISAPEWPKRWEKSICTKVVMALSSQVHPCPAWIR